jgi:hypothetical protein
MEQLIQLLYLDEVDPSGIVYPATVVGNAIQEFEKIIQKHDGVLGECSVPSGIEWDGEPQSRYMSIDLSRVSHIVKHLWIEKRRMMCKVKLLGKYAEIAKHMDIEFMGVPRATGVIEGKAPERVCTKYDIITVDLALPDML